MTCFKKPLTLASAVGALLLGQNAEALQLSPLFHPFEDACFHRGSLFDRTGARGMTIYEKGGQVVIEAPLPGLKEEEVEVTIDRNILSIRGQGSDNEGDEDTKFYCRSSNQFSYSVRLPDGIDQSEPEAKLKNGMFRIAFSLKAEAQPRRINFQS